MNYKDYFPSIRSQGTAHEKRTRSILKSNRKKYDPNTAWTSKGFLNNDTLNLRVSALKERFKDNPQLLEDLRSHYEAFILNLTVSKELRVKDHEKKLRKEFSNYLSKLEKEK